MQLADVKPMLKTVPAIAKRRGATSVEFAMVGPVIFLVILGMIEVGRGIMVCHFLTGAARQGCRVGIIEGKSNTDILGIVNKALAASGISGDTALIYVNDVTGANIDAGNAKPGDEITVTILVPVSKITWVPGGQYLSGNLKGQYTLRRE